MTKVKKSEIERLKSIVGKATRAAESGEGAAGALRVVMANRRSKPLELAAICGLLVGAMIDRGLDVEAVQVTEKLAELAYEHKLQLLKQKPLAEQRRLKEAARGKS